MRKILHQSSKPRIDATSAGCMESEPRLDTPEDLIAATVSVLNDMRNIVSHQSFTHPDTLTEDSITTYALALMRLRECASAAGLERLMNACDALAVTVSQLIKDRSCVCRKKCEALTRFVVHADAMIRISTDSAKRHAVPLPDIRTASDKVSVERYARISL